MQYLSKYLSKLRASVRAAQFTDWDYTYLAFLAGSFIAFAVLV